MPLIVDSRNLKDAAKTQLMRATSNGWQDKKKLLQKVTSDEKRMPILNQASSHFVGSMGVEEATKYQTLQHQPVVMVRDMMKKGGGSDQQPSVENLQPPIEVKF